MVGIGSRVDSAVTGETARGGVQGEGAGEGGRRSPAASQTFPEHPPSRPLPCTAPSPPFLPVWKEVSGTQLATLDTSSVLT